MISWAADDFNMEKICTDINKFVHDYKMHDYHVYGLKNEGRPHVRIHAANPQLELLFKKSGYLLEVSKPIDDGVVIGIGLRHDLRKNVKVSRQLIKTIVLAFENKLVTTESSVLFLGVQNV